MTEADMERLSNEVGGAGFDAAKNVKVKTKYVGMVVNGETLQAGEMISTGYQHYLKHVVDRGEWPAGTDYNKYVGDLMKVINDPNSRILLSKYSGEDQVTFIGELARFGEGIPVIVNYRLSREAWMNGYVLRDGEDYLKGLENIRWLR